MGPVEAEPSGMPAPRRGSWRLFGFAWLTTAGLTLAALLGAVLALDPYGVRAGPGRTPTALMDLNGRSMYPQLARSARFDAAIFGTSTVRLIDPLQLDAAFRARFASLGLNAGTPWEQMQLASLFLRHVTQPRMLVFGLDRTWCEPDADRKRLTFRAFPAWLYAERRWSDPVHLLDLKSLELAGRVALHAAGLMPARIRQDGYEVFTPPESTYDLARARGHIHGPGDSGLALTPARDGAGFPALAWLDDLLARVPASTLVVLLLPPVHVVSQAPADTPEAAGEAACKDALAAIARRRGAGLVDFRFPSPITRQDSNYWDKLHYRRPIAAEIVDALAQAAAGGQAPANGSYVILARPRSP